MPAAVAIPLIYGAAKVGEAVVQHRAAGKAMDTQQKGANQALAANSQAYAQQQALYQSMLGGASNTLSRLSTPGPGAQFAAGGPPVGQFSAPGMMPGMNNGAPAPGQRPQSSLGGFAGIVDRAGQAQGMAPRGQQPNIAQQIFNSGGGLGSLAGGLGAGLGASAAKIPGAGAIAPGLHNYGGGGESAGMPQPQISVGQVNMRGPDGSMAPVPLGMVSQHIRQGWQMAPGSPQSLAALGQVRM
jgi:hypothetical protein